MSKTQEIVKFEMLKKLVVSKFRVAHPAVSEDTLKWSGQDITVFQEDLQEKVQTTISEKWFYTYFKQEKLEKLPRIDMLNLLCEYCGEDNWTNFTNKVKGVNSESLSKSKVNLKMALAIPVVLIIVGFLFFPSEKTYNFCFVDKDVDLPITSALQISILKEGQSPIVLETEENGCFTFNTKEKSIQFIVSSPYYKSDTITRYYNKNAEDEQVKLSADEYALILHYFSTNNVEDWNQRRTELGRMIHDEAVIYQVFGEDEIGIDVLSKEAFINKITLPTSSLRNMKIIEIKRENGQIMKLKFAVITYE